MGRYILLAVGIRFLVDLMLLVGVNMFSGAYASPGRSLLGAAVGSIYAVCCFVPGLAFLNSLFCHGIFLLLSCWAAFGFGRSALVKWLVYCLSKTALECLTADLGAAANLCCAAVLCGVCVWMLRRRQYTPVELRYGSTAVRIQALYDTGNLLRDPITGTAVLIVGADVAEKLTGLSVSQLQHPVQTMGAIPGLRLIPCHTVSQTQGLLLALQLKHTKIGKKEGSCVVAFSPQILDEGGKFSALIGGCV